MRTRPTTTESRMEWESVHRPRNLIGALSGMGIPQRMFPVKHRRVLSVSVNPLDGTPTQAVDSLSINNLAATYGSRQPMGYDQFNALYERFKVTKCKITAFYQAQGNTPANEQLICGIQFSENSSWGPSDVETVLERGFCKFKPLGLANGSPSVVKISKTWSLAGWYGAENSKGVSATGTNSGAPTEECYAHVFVANGSTNNTDGAWVTVIMDYEVEWFGPKQLNVST